MGIGKPMSLWKMQETSGSTVGDFIGANAGTATSGNARRFNGTSDYVQFSNPVIPLGAKMIKFKIKATNTTADHRYILGAGSGSSGYGLFIQLTSSGTIRVGSWIGANGSFGFDFESLKVVRDGKWHEVLFAWDGSTNADAVKLYIDDMSVPDKTGTSSSAESITYDSNLYIGRSPVSASLFLNADLDDLQILNGSGTIVAHWKMDEASGVIVDSSPNAWAILVNSGPSVISNDSMPIIVSDGLGGYARRFNGRSDRITFTSKVVPIGNKTIRFKMRKGQLDPTFTYGRIISTGWTGNSPDSALEIYTRPTGDTTLPGAISIQIRNAGTLVAALTSDINVCDNQWHELLFIVDTANRMVHMYIDNTTTPHKSITFESGVSEPSAWTKNLLIGAMDNSTTLVNFFSGDLKDIQINVGTGTERTDPKDMEIGDFIRCHYQASSGQVGTFSQLGTATSQFIPPASSATPNGSFYWIMVGYEFDGSKKLIADRNLAHSISWDSINSEGMTNTGREITL